MAHIDENPLGRHLPLDPLPGHSSRGRLERVLRRGEFAVTAELNPPDSANPEDVYERAAIFEGWVDGINATVMVAYATIVARLHPDLIEERLHPPADAKRWDRPLAAIVAVVGRGDESIPPRGSTVIRPGDHLFVLAPRSKRRDVDDVFARWRRTV